MKPIISSLLITLQIALFIAVPSAYKAQAQTEAQTQAQAQPFRLVAYFTEWGVYGRNYHVANIPADKITHLNYAFAGIQDNRISILDSYAALEKAYPSDVGLPAGALKGNFRQLQLLKQQYPNLKVLISVGGWTGSQNFSAMAGAADSRQTFIQSVIAFMNQYGFDGLDIDWEYPVIGGAQAGLPQDRANFTALLSEARAAFGSQYLLTVAVGASQQAIDAIDYAQVQQQVDWISLMSYDFHGAWEAGSSQAEHHAALYDNGDPLGPNLNVSAAVTLLQSAAVPASKIVPGLPFYGRSFAGTDGLLSPFTAAGPGTYETGVLDYKDIATNYLGKNGYQYFWDEQAQAPYLYNQQQKVFVSYDNARSIAAKAAYARERQLGGLMVWELSGDNGDLIAAMQAAVVAPSPTPTPSPAPAPEPTNVAPSPTTTYTPAQVLASSPDINTDKGLVSGGGSAPCVSGSLVKNASSPAVYYCGADGKRYVFPNERVYATWYANFDGIIILSDQQLAVIPLGGNITYRPGVKMVKSQTDPKVYALERGGVLRWIKTPEIASALYGADWNKKIDYIPDTFFWNYSLGEPIES